jgi:hypothetical protein
MKINSRIDLEAFAEKVRMAGLIIPDNIELVVKGPIDNMELLNDNVLEGSIWYRTRTDLVFKIIN